MCLRRDAPSGVRQKGHRTTLAYFTRTLAATTATITAALDTINRDHALAPLAAEDVAVFRALASSQAVDSYHTRMAESTLRNFAAEAERGVPILNNHRTGSRAELPVGRVFMATLSGLPLPANAAYEATGGLSLTVDFYVQRGLRVTDIATDDLIRAIEGGVIKDVSVGFSLGSLRCAICGLDMFACPHEPGQTYAEGRAFAWIEDATLREVSLVWKGATEGAAITGQMRALPDPDWLPILDGLRLVSPDTARSLEQVEPPQRPEALAAAWRALQTRAELGDRWLHSLIERAVEARTRAEYDHFDVARYRDLLRQSADPAYIQREIESWERLARTIFGDGKRPTRIRSRSATGPTEVYRG